jgi:uncharacterized membrane protein
MGQPCFGARIASNIQRFVSNAVLLFHRTHFVAVAIFVIGVAGVDTVARCTAYRKSVWSISPRRAALRISFTANWAAFRMVLMA